MRSQSNDSKPAWWLLYGMGLGLIGLIGLIEATVPASGLRTVLEMVLVILMFVLMMSWVRHNRLAMELNGREPAPVARRGNDGDSEGTVPPQVPAELVGAAAPSPDRRPSDAALVEAMQRRMARESWLSPPGARIYASEGVLELWGLVATTAEKRNLETMARVIPGCQGVVSHLVTRDDLVRTWGAGAPSRLGRQEE